MGFLPNLPLVANAGCSSLGALFGRPRSGLARAFSREGLSVDCLGWPCLLRPFSGGFFFAYYPCCSLDRDEWRSCWRCSLCCQLLADLGGPGWHCFRLPLHCCTWLGWCFGSCCAGIIRVCLLLGLGKTFSCLCLLALPFFRCCIFTGGDGVGN